MRMLFTITFLGTVLIAGDLAHCAADSVIGQDAPRSTPQSTRQNPPQNIPQNPPSNIAQERAAMLRQQLVDVEAQQAELQTRLRQLEEDSKPENIEKSIAGVGSTRPEDLREQRRRLFGIQRTNLEFQLDRLAKSKTRLETGIAQADADAYRLSAGGNTLQPVTGTQQRSSTGTDATQQGTAESQTNSSTTVRRRPRRPRKNKPRPRQVRQPARASVPTQAEANA